MPTIHITIQGVDEAIARLGQLGVMNVLEPAMKTSLHRLQYYMAKYPPAPPRSSYRRTGTLGRKWTIAVPDIFKAGNELHGKIGILLSYAPFVQSQRFQARIHRNRWRTDQMAMQENQQAIVRDFEQAIRAALR